MWQLGRAWAHSESCGRSPEGHRTPPLTETGLLVAALTLPLWVMTPLDIFDKFGAAKFQVIMLIAIGVVLVTAMRASAAGTFSVRTRPALIFVGLLVLQSLAAALALSIPVMGVWGNTVRYDGFLMILANARVLSSAYGSSRPGSSEWSDLVARRRHRQRAGGGCTRLCRVRISIRSCGSHSARRPSCVQYALGNPIFLGAFCAMAFGLRSRSRCAVAARGHFGAWSRLWTSAP